MICLTIAAIFASDSVSAQIIPGNISQVGAYSFFDGVHNTYLSLGLRKYVNSFTSYEFLDPDLKFVEPLSKLEWP